MHFIPAVLAAFKPISLSSTTQQRFGFTLRVVAANKYTSGAGFFFATTSPAKIWILLRRSSPSKVLAIVVTAASLDVLQIATFKLLAKASSINLMTREVF